MQAFNVYQAVFIPSDDGGFEVSFPQFPGCVTFGDTFEAAQAAASEALGLWIEELQARGTFNSRQAQKRPIITEIPVPTT